MSESVRLTIENNIATITLDRADKRNAMNGDVIQLLRKLLQTVANDEKARVLMIVGAGEHFCAGADIQWMQQIAMGSYETNENDAQALADLMYQLYTFPKPTIVLAHGATLGGGLGLLAACDIALGASDAVFGFSEVSIGIAPSTISPYVIAAIGERAARYYFVTGERFKADKAHSIGLLHKVTEPNALLSTGIAIAGQLLKNSPRAMLAAKQLIRHVAKVEISEALAQHTAEHLANLRATPEAQEGLRAFSEKRLPVWK